MKFIPHLRRLAGALLVATLAATPVLASQGSMHRLHDHVPSNALAKARWLSRMPAASEVSLVFSLPLRNQQELDQLLKHLYDPNDPQHGKYLTPQEFTERFAPTQADYDAVAEYARSIGLRVTASHANRLLLDVAGPAEKVEGGFGLQLHHYQGADGRKFYAPDQDPAVPEGIAARVNGVVGLDSATSWHAHSNYHAAGTTAMATPYQIGSGPGGGLTPSNIRSAYNLANVAATGSGQVLALFELDGYNPSDVAYYAKYFGLPAVPLQNVLVDGFSGAPGTGASEVTLDIELQLALAPGVSKILVYEGPNSNKGVLDTYNRIATDNLAKQISTSWGLSEGQSSQSVIASENAIFQQMAAQGQTLYAAAGDSGAYDNGSTLSVDDPASQPYVVGVGGTRLAVASGQSYLRESAWNTNNTVAGGAGGGGVSALWSIPSWQQGVRNLASSVMRNVPDVALNADQGTGYSIYFQGGWYIFGGTSCASPLWAAFTARVNQLRSAAGQGPLGFANPVLYQLAAGSGYQGSFHDVADSTTNLYYPAITGYDNATGWGSFNGANLLAALAPTTTVPSAPAPPAAPSGLSAVAGNATVTLAWGAVSGATSYSVYRGSAPGAEGTTPIATGLGITGYSDTRVSNGTRYYYKVSATNGGGTSPLSSEVSATPSTPVVPALSITSGPTASTAPNTVLIQWSTNLASNAVLRIGTSATNLSNTFSASTLSTTHAFKLSGVARRTTYYYQVSSTAAGATVSSQVKSFVGQ
ncbi:hypothetical protein GMLC_09260 [Geomonas limicola]|uniref:Pseudomonapepsin n=1 Tax=Geomonas limicola TaxID=2740186 RepID=A0A6V8N6A4_9BACT|nr:protease pro-enzyme activation domain-containing protein [Geomonas limicola]GFO67347.1 hypothetical protein GMLC_09260 [Geomonas limicola]